MRGWPHHDEVIDGALNSSIASMIEALGEPTRAFVGRIFPSGWLEQPRYRRIELHALCRRSFPPASATSGRMPHDPSD